MQLTQERVLGNTIPALGLLLAALVSACLLLVSAGTSHAATVNIRLEARAG